MKRISVVLALLLAMALPNCRPTASPVPRPSPAPRAGTRLNVLLITIDTLRADHLGAYGYRRKTSPHIDAIARKGTVFEQAYTFWPKTRGSFVMMMTGRRPSQNGYSKQNPELLGFNATLASTLKEAGYRTVAAVDNPNVDAKLGYAKGFDRYQQTWETIREPARESERARLITEEAGRVIYEPAGDRPFFLWLHYVNPHGPYTPRPPFDTIYLDAESQTGPVLKAVKGFHNGVREEWAKPGQRLGYYIAQYDGEIAAADYEVGRVLEALQHSPVSQQTVIVVTSDHGESLGEHGYFFDHGEDLFDPCLRIPLIVYVPGAQPGRTGTLASTLDILPTILDAVKVSYPPDLAGRSLLAEATGRSGSAPERLFAQNERDLSATFDQKLKLVAKSVKGSWQFALYDRAADPTESRDASAAQPEPVRLLRRELELFWERGDREMAPIRARLASAAATPTPCLDPADCENLKSLGYVPSDTRCDRPCP